MTANPVRARRISTGKVGHHCVKISRGCANCYAEVFDGRFGTQLPYVARSEQDIEMFVDDAVLHRMIKLWKPQKIFVCDMTDLFQSAVTDEQIDRVFAGFHLADRQIIQVLTKRAKRAKDYISAPGRAEAILKQARQLAVGLGPDRMNAAVAVLWPLPNVWLGVSVEDSVMAAERIPLLRETPAAIRYLSIEPLLEDLGELDLDGIDWVIAGGESGPKARPMHMDWVRSIRDQCVAAGVPFHFKQVGSWATVYDRDIDDPDWRNCPKVQGDHERYLNIAGGHGFHGDRVCFVRRVGKKAAGRMLDGRTWDEMPEVGR